MFQSRQSGPHSTDATRTAWHPGCTGYSFQEPQPSALNQVAAPTPVEETCTPLLVAHLPGYVPVTDAADGQMFTPPEGNLFAQYGCGAGTPHPGGGRPSTLFVSRRGPSSPSRDRSGGPWSGAPSTRLPSDRSRDQKLHPLPSATPLVDAQATSRRDASSALMSTFRLTDC